MDIKSQDTFVQLITYKFNKYINNLQTLFTIYKYINNTSSLLE